MTRERNIGLHFRKPAPQPSWPMSGSVNVGRGVEHPLASMFSTVVDEKISGCQDENRCCILEIVKENMIDWDY